jgi:protein-L-isoaspartate(D-aspartate) O-methyltransferase
VKIAYPPNPQAERMVRQQLRARGIAAEDVLQVMCALPRHRFVSKSVQAEAYGDFPLPIGRGQTISQPYMVGLMTAELGLSPWSRVLEIGTGSGYQTAVLAELAGEVYTVELIPSLLERAQRLLAELGYMNIRCRCADGTAGWPEEAPFDAILVAAAAPTVPSALASQLADNGVLVVPVGRSSAFQTLITVRRRGGLLQHSEGIGCRFVPLVSSKP